MKRPSIPKRRDRKAGQSPYAKYAKQEFKYSCGRYHPLSPKARGEAGPVGRQDRKHGKEL